MFTFEGTAYSLVSAAVGVVLGLAISAGMMVKYGKYLALSCAACHGDDLAGDFGPNITPGGTPGRWSEADFIRTLRFGTTPDGRKLDSEDMPWKSFARLTNDEIKAIWLYLKSVPPVSAN
jgi:mono/diheme cytochrome c family protein